MDSAYTDASALWDLSHSTNFAQVPDDDFMAILQKQFPLSAAPSDLIQNAHSLAAGGFSDGVNPQNISRYSLSSLTPPSEDSSSPSPPHNAGSNHDSNTEDGGEAGGGGGGTFASQAGMPESALKRKASGVGMQEDGPSQKSQHTLSNDKKGATSNNPGSRRKSTGNVAKDEGRLLKRKEQNRAAQRAFRERKEKHVKDLEDKVAELEAKNDAAQHENENLRDLLSRLQSENVVLKQSNFTFAMPAKSQTDPTTAPRHISPESAHFGSSPPSSVISPTSSISSPKPTNMVDWTSLTSFDPNMLNLLDENPQQTATSSAMNIDLFGDNTGVASNSPFTMIASNPVFMSFVSSFDGMSPPAGDSLGIVNGNGNRSNGQQQFGFDLNQMSSWPAPTPTQDTTSLDDLFAGYLNPSQNTDFVPQFDGSTPSISPVTHQATVNTNFASLNSNVNSFMQNQSPGTNLSSMPSPSSQSTASSEPLLNTPKESQSVSVSATPESDHRPDNPMACPGNDGLQPGSLASLPTHRECPKTKTELVQRIADAGSSPFAPPALQKSSDHDLGTMIPCAGTKFPRTAKSDNNVEVLTAWRSITSNPVFKEANIDINDLCTEFTSKAKCDGTKVVLEPEEMQCIMKSLAAKTQ